MENAPNNELIGDVTSRILGNLGLDWKDLDNKDVLDVGALDVKLARAAKKIGSSANIFSVDMDYCDSWTSLPTDIKNKTVVALAEDLPFPDETFDLIVNNGSINPLEIKDEIRVLKSGGEIRVAPIGGFILEIWVISYYLDKYKNWPQKKVEKITNDLEEKVIESEQNGDGFLPKEFINLRNMALKTLKQEEKIGLIKSLTNLYSEKIGAPLSYKIRNPEGLEPEGYVIYKKPF
jgi:hypothetical protein